MIFRLLILFQIISVLGGESAPKEDKIKAWIEIEGELISLSVRAKIENWKCIAVAVLKIKRPYRKVNY